MARAALAIRLTFAFDLPADPPSGLVVPLTPTALDRCRRTGAKYGLVDDLVDRPAVLGDADDDLRWQVAWIGSMGDALGAPDACRATAQMLKTPVDSVIVWSRLLRAVLEGVRPTTLGYVGPHGDEEADPLHNGHLQFWPRLGDLPLAARLLPLLARDFDLRLEATATALSPPRPEGTASSRAGAIAPVAVATAGAVRARLAPLRHRAISRPQLRQRRDATLLTWQGGYGLGRIARAERDRGAEVLFLRRGRPDTAILRLGPFGYRPIHHPIAVGPQPTLKALPSVAAALLREVDHRSALIGAGSALRRRLEVYNSRVIPSVERLAAAIRPELERAGVTRVISANPWSLEEFATLLAARQSSIERVLYQHGDHAFSYDGWLLAETGNFDAVMTSDPTVAVDMAEGAVRLGLPVPKMRLGDHRVPAAVRSRPAGRTVCYVPATLTGDTAVLPRMYFEDAWYFRWQQRLLAEMRSRPDTHFVWKALPAADQSEDRIPAVLRHENIANVRYETRPFPEILPRVSRVLLDFPSTALYEAIRAGVATTCVTFSRFAVVRARALDLLDGVLHTCEREESALTVVRRFLDAPEEIAVDAVVRCRERLLSPVHVV